MEESIRKAIEYCIKNPELDLRTFEQSNEYSALNIGIPLSEHIGAIHPGLPIIIDGDLDSIIISKKNEVALIILYALVGVEKRYARVIIKSSASVDFVRRELLPMTHICLSAQYTERRGEFIGIGITLYNKPLMYGHYISPVCGYDYGIDKEYDGRYCDICADDTISKLEYVD